MCRYIVNFPTKTHWRTESRINHVTDGLRALAAFVEQYQPTSMAVPALGRGLGGLDLPDVVKAVRDELGRFPQRVEFVLPSKSPAAVHMAP